MRETGSGGLRSKLTWFGARKLAGLGMSLSVDAGRDGWRPSGLARSAWREEGGTGKCQLLQGMH